MQKNSRQGLNIQIPLKLTRNHKIFNIYQENSGPRNIKNDSDDFMSETSLSKMILLRIILKASERNN